MEAEKIKKSGHIWFNSVKFSQIQSNLVKFGQQPGRSIPGTFIFFGIGRIGLDWVGLGWIKAGSKLDWVRVAARMTPHRPAEAGPDLRDIHALVA
jgi:hypothetical protein